MSTMFTTNTWKELQEHRKNETRENDGLYSGRGITNRSTGTTTLKSQDGTPFYDDDLSDPKMVKYTLYGKKGNQDLNHQDNRGLICAKRIYLYRVNKNKQNKYMWYGEYKIQGEPVPKQHPDVDGIMRTIYEVTLILI